MSKGFKTIIIIWLIAVSAISLSALCRSFYHDTALQVDYMGIITGILAVLCTVLIGWQIYSLIDFNKREEKNQKGIASLTEIIKAYRENGNRGDYLLYDNLSEICESIISNDNDSLKYERLHYKINAINYASRIGEYDVCVIGIDVIKLFIQKHKITLPEKEKERLLKFACSIPNQQKIKNFTELINIIASIKI